MNPKEISIQDYSYHLPPERIASFPLPERDASKLLVYKKGVISETIYRNIANEIPENALMVFNETKVVEARIFFKKETGGVIEIFCLEPFEPKELSIALHQTYKVQWKCMIGGADKWKHGIVLTKTINSLKLSAKIIHHLSDAFVVEFSWDEADISFSEILHLAGNIPLPPYIKREADESDKERYQTIYAHNEGSVAAPTAGLHFTDYVMHKLSEKNIQKTFVTLHVGAGTFKPVKSAKMKDHVMHGELIELNANFIETIKNNLDKPIIVVGTTSLRTIETLYWMGAKLNQNPLYSWEQCKVNQWDSYEMNLLPTPKQALEKILQKMEKDNVSSLLTSTQLMIAPGYKLKLANAIVTNFHQPNSTLLLLVAAFIGNDWKKVYDYALNNNFRFLSYGDGSLLWRNNS